MIKKISYCEPKSGGKPKQLVVFLHGFGSNKDDLIALSEYFSEILPEALFVAPNAPKELDIMYNAYSWFSLDGVNLTSLEIPTNVKTEASNSAEELNNFIDKLLTEYDIPNENVYLIGFSQGATMSVMAGVRRKTPVKVILAYSGLLINEKNWVSIPKQIGISHGKQDDVVPFEWHNYNLEILKSHSNNVKSLEVENCFHEIPLSAIEFGKKILKESL